MIAVFDPLRLSAVALDVLAAGRATAGALAARQQVRLTRLLDVAVRGSPLYRERLKGKALRDLTLGALPKVSKNELMARFDDWVTDPQLKLAELRTFVADPQRIGDSYLDKYLIWESSGTSNQSGVFVQDAQAMAVYDALEALRRSTPRALQRWFDPLLMAERIAFVGATSGHFASFVSMQRMRQLNPWMAQNVRCFSILDSMSALVDKLNAFAPTVIATYPTFAAVLADAACGGALHFLPKEVWTGGETLSVAVRRRVEQALGCSVRNSYGASEFMSIGWECSFGRMHANTDWVILEPVDERGLPMPAGQPSYSTLLTNLANHVQPLIRYDLGDQITVHHERCECGSSLPVIEVQGRRDDPLVMAGSNGHPVTLLPLALTTVLEDEAGVFDFHLRQRDDHTLVLRLEMHGPQAASVVTRCRAVLQDFAAAQGAVPIRVIAELGQVVPKGRSGKAQRVVARQIPKRH
ncbi:MAG: phenylacetate--CoA ligase family protein [Rhodoferax sp.]|uniref:phenylacetate--CoA ligase family protein n=1 Tax=Rhodoferax sp. TaxID=50421 RepID=UPI00271E767F|nr:phenylacetate--CoA ligase family protein [Rhodoferax sp.]MDO8450663.1 phenylacetate--CoA ligase family protein [Rhodoferax sp.]